MVRHWTAGVVASLLSGTCLSAAEAPGGAFSPAIGLIDQSRQLAAYARNQRDPLGLIVAARLLRDSGARAGRLRPATGAAAPEMAQASPSGLVTEAKRLAKGRRDIARLADAVLESHEKGRERGPLYEIGAIAAGASDEFPSLRFAGGARAEIYVDSNQPVAIAVYDASGQIICRDDRNSPVAYCWWRQAQPGEIRVEISNRSAVQATYRLVTN